MFWPKVILPSTGAINHSYPVIWEKNGDVTSVAISPDNQIIASGNSLGNIAFWGITSLQLQQIGQTISDVLKNPNDENLKSQAKELVKNLTQQFPIYQNLYY